MKLVLIFLMTILAFAAKTQDLNRDDLLLFIRLTNPNEYFQTSNGDHYDLSLKDFNLHDSVLSFRIDYRHSDYYSTIYGGTELWFNEEGLLTIVMYYDHDFLNGYQYEKIHRNQLGQISRVDGGQARSIDTIISPIDEITKYSNHDTSIIRTFFEPIYTYRKKFFTSKKYISDTAFWEEYHAYFKLDSLKRIIKAYHSFEKDTITISYDISNQIKSLDLNNREINFFYKENKVDSVTISNLEWGRTSYAIKYFYDDYGNPVKVKYGNLRAIQSLIEVDVSFTFDKFYEIRYEYDEHDNWINRKIIYQNDSITTLRKIEYHVNASK